MNEQAPRTHAEVQKNGTHGRRVAIILNGLSLKKQYFYTKILPELNDFNIEVFETRAQKDGVDLAARAVEKGFDVIVAAGGDGTLNEVVNGMLAGNEHRTDLPALGLIPLGSGNDFARTVKITAEVRHLRNLIESLMPRHIDVGRINFTESAHLSPRYFVNIADVGMGPVVVKRVLESGRPFGSLVQYYVAILRTFLTYRLTHIRARAPLWKWEGKVRVMAIANGRFFGNGICIAPEAVANDGKFSCFIAGNVSVIDFLIQNGRLRKGKRPVHDAIEYKEAERVQLRSDIPMPIEADGELVGELPVEIDILYRKLPFLR